MKYIISAVAILGIALASCGSVNSTQSIQNRTQAVKVSEFKYLYIAPAKGLAMNPTEIIKDWAIKNGFTMVKELSKATNAETIIVNFGEISKQIPGRPKMPFEVKVQFVSAKNFVEITTCRSHGQGATDEEEVRSAILQCLNKINL